MNETPRTDDAVVKFPRAVGIEITGEWVGAGFARLLEVERNEVARLSHEFRNQRDAYKRDAERYRWIRAQPMDTLLDLYLGINDNASGAEWDAAIDEAMAKDKAHAEYIDRIHP